MMKLVRKEKRSDGIFGELYDGLGVFVCFTLEHSYEIRPSIYEPKVPIGSYVCMKGLHRLEGMTHDFTTFEVTGVANHSNILLHMGNFNCDSAGCILVGEKIENSDKGQMITNSKKTFEKLMERLQNIKGFYLHVIEEIQG